MEEHEDIYDDDEANERTNLEHPKRRKEKIKQSDKSLL